MRYTMQRAVTLQRSVLLWTKNVLCISYLSCTPACAAAGARNLEQNLEHSLALVE